MHQLNAVDGICAPYCQSVCYGVASAARRACSVDLQFEAWTDGADSYVAPLPLKNRRARPVVPVQIQEVAPCAVQHQIVSVGINRWVGTRRIPPKPNGVIPAIDIGAVNPKLLGDV